jgi:hypothetical protein
VAEGVELIGVYEVPGAGDAHLLMERHSIDEDAAFDMSAVVDGHALLPKAPS